MSLYSSMSNRSAWPRARNGGRGVAHDMHDTRPTRAMVAHTCGAHQGAGVTLARLQVNGDLMVAGEERDEGKERGVGGEGKGEVRMRGKLVATAPCMAVRI